ncbi:MAG: elongation factor G [Chitinispirillia bacterium]
MKKYDAKSIHNVCLLSHGGVGKTSLLEASCYTAGATKKLGKVDNGTSIFDNRADEKERKMTISMSVGSCEWNNAKINFLDSPGFLDLLGDARAAMRVVEAAVLLIDASSGIQVGTESVSRIADEDGVPIVCFINGMDKENVDYSKTIDELNETYGTSVAPIQLPIGSGANFRGVIDLITKVAYEYAPDGKGRGKKIDIPAEMADDVETMRGTLMEAIAESDENLLEKYFEVGELTEDELSVGLSRGVVEGLVIPVLCGCAIKNMGVDLFLNAMVTLCPSADTRKEITTEDGSSVACLDSEPSTAFVFKTISEEHVGELNIVRVFSGSITTGQELLNTTRDQTERIGNMFFMRGLEKIDANEISAGDIGGLLKMKDTHTNDTLSDKSKKIQLPKIIFDEPLVNIAISAKSKGDEDKVSTGLKKLREEDPTFSYKYHGDIHQSILSARGDIHISIILENLKNRFKIDVNRKPPKISYRETITKSSKYVEYTHKKQSGGAGQYARVFIDLEPAERGQGYEFIDKIVGGVIDQPLRPSVDKGIKAKLDEGILAGYPIVDVKVTLVDGKTHPVDSKDIAFQIAGREVFKKAFEMSSPILLEPIANLKINVPEEYTGDIMGDLSSRRGKIGGMDPDGKYQTINAKVPESEIVSYSQALRSMTQGRGFYSKSFSHYDPVPHEVAKKIIEESKVDSEENS